MGILKTNCTKKNLRLLTRQQHHLEQPGAAKNGQYPQTIQKILKFQRWLKNQDVEHNNFSGRSCWPHRNTNLFAARHDSNGTTGTLHHTDRSTKHATLECLCSSLRLTLERPNRRLGRWRFKKKCCLFPTTEKRL